MKKPRYILWCDFETTGLDIDTLAPIEGCGSGSIPSPPRGARRKARESPAWGDESAAPIGADRE